MDDGKQLIYTHFVAGAAALAVLEDGDVAAGRHAVVGRQVDVLDPARAAVVGGAGAVGLAVPGGPGGEPLAVVVGRDVGAGRELGGAARAAGDERRQDGRHGHDVIGEGPHLTVIRMCGGCGCDRGATACRAGWATYGEDGWSSAAPAASRAQAGRPLASDGRPAPARAPRGFHDVVGRYVVWAVGSSAPRRFPHAPCAEPGSRLCARVHGTGFAVRSQSISTPTYSSPSSILKN